MTTYANAGNGGSAFPLYRDADDERRSNEGMTLRDYFAARAMQAWIASTPPDGKFNPVSAATIAYAYADAMLVERQIK